jgi:phage terminase large subunit GpA-like protein
LADCWKALKPPPNLTISQWADEERFLSPEASAEPGRWRTDTNEFQRGIMDAISDPLVETVVVLCSSQVGKTEMLLNTIGYYIHHDPSPILVVQPTIKMAETFSKDRLAPMLRDTPALKGRIRDPRERDSGNTIDHKIFDGGHITLSGSNSPASLASRPIRVLLVDELDRFDESVGGEGDPLSVVRTRTARFWNRKIVVVSTPTVKGASRIVQAYAETDQRKCHVPCPDCDEPQVLKWEQVRWDKDVDKDGKTVKHHPETAHYVCEHCGVLWDDVSRWNALRQCFWEATAPFTGSAGFGGVWEAYAFGSRLSDVVRRFLSDKNDPSRLQTFVNTVLGQEWEEFGETVQAGSLIQRVEAYDDKSLPSGIALLTVGVDIQDDRIEAQIIGWGPNEESWVVWYEVIPGDPSQPHIWKELDGLLLSGFQRDDGRQLKIASACVDTGGHHGDTAISFCKQRRIRKIYPTKGMAGPKPVWPMRASRTKTNEQIYMVGVDTAKDTIYGRLKIGEPGPGFVHFPALDGIDSSYFEQLTSERVATRFREGRPYRVWVLEKGKRNEALDTFVLALAARKSLPRHIERNFEYAPGSNAHQPVAGPEVYDPEPGVADAAEPEVRARQLQLKPKRKPFRFGTSVAQMRDPYL